MAMREPGLRTGSIYGRIYNLSRYLPFETKFSLAVHRSGCIDDRYLLYLCVLGYIRIYPLGSVILPISVFCGVSFRMCLYGYTMDLFTF